MKDTGLEEFPFEEPLEGSDDAEAIKAKNDLELGNPGKPVKDLPFKKEKNRPPTGEEAAEIEAALVGAAQRGDAKTREKMAELRANIESIGQAIVEATTKGPEGAKWLEERYGGKDQASLEMLRSELELTGLELAENSERSSKEKDPARAAELRKKRDDIAHKSAALKKEIADLARKRDDDDIARIRRGLPKKGR